MPVSTLIMLGCAAARDLHAAPHPRWATTCTPSAATPRSPGCPACAPRSPSSPRTSSARCSPRMAGLLLLARLSVGSPTIGSPGRLRPDVHRGRRARRHPARRRQGQHRRHPRRRRHLRGDRQRHGRHAGQPVPQGRRPRRRDRGRRRGLRPPRARPPPGPIRTTRPASTPPCRRRDDQPCTTQPRPTAATEPLPAHQRRRRRAASPSASATPGGAVFVLVGALLVAIMICQPELRRPRRALIRFAGRTAPIAIAAMGQYYVIVSGEFDLSMGAVITTQVVMAGNLIGQDEGRILPGHAADAARRRADRPRQRAGRPRCSGCRASSSPSA